MALLKMISLVALIFLSNYFLVLKGKHILYYILVGTKTHRIGGNQNALNNRQTRVKYH